MSKQALGKGLSALIEIDDEAVVSQVGGVQELPLSSLKPGKYQPRSYFADEALKELADSIKANGVLQPILVREVGKNSYEIIAGERRYRAARQAGLETIPVVIKNLEDDAALEIALIENIQRENLTPIEEAEGYKKLQEEFGYTQEKLAKILGKSRTHITNMLRLLSLPQSVKDLLEAGKISTSHARALINSPDSEALAHKIINENLNVRDAEKFAGGHGRTASGHNAKKTGQGRAIANSQKDEDLLALERSLSESIGLKVAVEDSAEGGRVILYFNNLTELDKILQRIG